jgi:hypothetical protein
MAATLKSLQDAKSALTGLMTNEGTWKTVEGCANLMKEYDKKTEALEDVIQALISDLQKTKNNTIDEAEQKELDAEVQRWYRSQLSNELKKVSGFCDTVLDYLLKAQKAVLNAK